MVAPSAYFWNVCSTYGANNGNIASVYIHGFHTPNRICINARDATYILARFFGA